MTSLIKISVISIVLLLAGCNSVGKNSISSSQKYACSDCEKKMNYIQESNSQLISENSSLRNQLENANNEIAAIGKGRIPTMVVALIFVGCFAAGFIASRYMASSKKV